MSGRRLLSWYMVANLQQFWPAFSLAWTLPPVALFGPVGSGGASPPESPAPIGLLADLIEHTCYLVLLMESANQGIHPQNPCVRLFNWPVY